MLNVKTLVLSVLALGCAASSPNTRGGKEAILSLEMSVLPIDGQKIERLAIGGALPLGAKYALKIQADRSAYLYLAETQTGDPTILDRSVKTEAGQVIHFPTSGAWLEQTSRTGGATFVLVAAPSPLGDPELLAATRGPSSKEPLHKREPPPQPVGEKNRGEVVEVIQAKKGVTVARFPFSYAASK